MANNKLTELEERLPHGRKDVAQFVKHVFDSLEQHVELHKKEGYMNAIAGIKPVKYEEESFEEKINFIKRFLITELEKTALEWEHIGDKHWNKIYKD